MKTRVFHTRFWKDSYIATLTHKEKLLFAYLITNENVNISGVYELPDKYILADLDLSARELKAIKEKFHKDKKIVFFNGWVRIVNVERFNKYVGPLNDKARLKELSFAPKDLLAFPFKIDTSIYTSSDTPRIGTRNKKSEISNKKTQYIYDEIKKIYKKVGDK